MPGRFIKGMKVKVFSPYALVGMAIIGALFAAAGFGDLGGLDVQAMVISASARTVWRDRFFLRAVCWTDHRPRVHQPGLVRRFFHQCSNLDRLYADRCLHLGVCRMDLFQVRFVPRG